MTSHLRNQSAFAPFSAHSTQASYPHNTIQRPQKKQKMTITQTYRLAHSARGKLSSEASRGDHDLRLLVGHANLLDTLMVELQDAENEQEEWFNQTMRNASPKSEEPRHIQWRDEVASQYEVADDEEEDSDSEDDSDDEFEIPIPARRIRSPPPTITTLEVDEDDDEESDDEYDNLELALVRTQSHSNVESLPELVQDSSDEEEDDASPPSTPPQVSIELPSPQKAEQVMLEEEGYFLPSEHQAPLIAAY